MEPSEVVVDAAQLCVCGASADEHVKDEFGYARCPEPESDPEDAA